MESLAPYIEQTLLRADASRTQIQKLCQEALHHRMVAVCVNGCWVEEARHQLGESETKVVAVVGFPLGAGDSDAKRYEAEIAVDQGAHEIDMVLNIGRFKDGEDAYVLREIRDVVEAADERPLKVIIETGFLKPEELVRACKLVVESGATFVKTSTGLGPRGANVEDVKRIREAVGPEFGIKASGGIRTPEFAWELIGAGANRIGTSSGVQLVQGS